LTFLVDSIPGSVISILCILSKYNNNNISINTNK